MKPLPWTEEEENFVIQKRMLGLTKSQVHQAMMAAGFKRSFMALKCKLKYLRQFQDTEIKVPEKRAASPNSKVEEGYKAPFSSRRYDLKRAITKVAAFFDCHFPFHINKSGINKMLQKMKPDLIILGGDTWSLDCISHHDKATFSKKGFDTVFEAFSQERAKFRAFISNLVYSNPQADVVYILGNHEVWLEKFCLDFPQIDSPDLNIILSGIPRLMILPYGSFYKVGHLNFCHGDQFGTENPAKQGCIRSKETVVFGHHHTYKVWSDFSMVDDNKKYLGIAVPTGAGRNPKYLKGRPNAWVSGFFTACVKQNGNFSPFVWMMSPKGTVIDPYGNEFD